MISNYSKLQNTWSIQDDPPKDYGWCDELSPETINLMRRIKQLTCYELFLL
jgi:hypothetical protein